LRYDPSVLPTEPVLQMQESVEGFPKLSSLSANCTDDFMLASGISPNIFVYDVHTGKVVHRAHGVHDHFINISRFSHTSPHIFATASFDHTCKVWDLRQPMLHDRPIKTLNTGGHNVMCVFSPDDRRILCSGVDTRIIQYDVPSWRQSPDHFPLRAPVHRERYRRSTYLADAGHFVTAATEESHMHVMSTEGEKLGVVNFRGVVRNWGEAHPAGEAERVRAGDNAQRRVAGPGRSPSRRFLAGLRQDGRAMGHDASHGHKGKAGRSLLRGVIKLDDADPNGGSSRNNHEFVQSIRAHPVVTNRIGVLLSLTQGETSYVALVDLHCQ